MPVLLDTETLAPGDRSEALREAFRNNTAPQIVTFSTSRPVRHRMELFELGQAAHMLRNTGTGLNIIRGPRQVRQAAPEQLAIGLQMRGQGLLEAASKDETCEPGHLVLVDVTRPYSFRQSVVSDHKVLLIEQPHLALPVDVVRAAAPLLKNSPLYDLVRMHLWRLCDGLGEVTPEVQAMVGRATQELVRALIATAADDVRQREALQATLQLRITLYIDAHLHDPSLDAEKIAAAHNVSTRQLYKLWARTDSLPLSQWIITRRLERAHNQLADLDPALTTIAAVARGCGFVDMSHFSRRFREAYGTTPRDWRLRSRVD